MDSHQDDPLWQAALSLCADSADERAAAERDLLEARQQAVPVLARLLDDKRDLPAGVLRRVSLLVAALKGRQALRGLFRHLGRDDVAAEARIASARAVLELVDGRDVFDDHVQQNMDTLLDDAEPQVRILAARAIAATGDPRGTARIEALLDDDSARVRAQVAKLVTERDDDQPAEGLAEIVEQAQEGGLIGGWIGELSHRRHQVRERAVGELVRLGDEAVPGLIDALNHDDLRRRTGAAQALGQLARPASAQPLLFAVTTTPSTSDTNAFRAAALRALANVLRQEEEGFTEAILPLTRDDDRFVRAAALLCLGRLGEAEGIRTILGALFDDDAYVVESAAVAISEGIRADSDALAPSLLAALSGSKHRPPALLEAVVIALSRLQLDDPAVKVRVRHALTPLLSGKTAALRKTAFALLERLFDDDDPPNLMVLDLALARLTDPHPEVRLVAASFLARHLTPGMTKAVERIKPAVVDGDRTAAVLLLDALVRHNTTTGQALLRRLTTVDDSTVAMRAAELSESFSPSEQEWKYQSRSSSKASALQPGPAPVAPRPSRVRAATIDEPAHVRAATIDEPARVRAATIDEPARVRAATIDEPARVRAATIDEPAHVRAATIDEPARVSAATDDRPARVRAAKSDGPVVSARFGDDDDDDAPANPSPQS